jgi:hypothetical protein
VRAQKNPPQQSDKRDITASVRGDATLPTNNHLHASTANGSQGVAQYTRQSDLMELTIQKELDVIFISEPGKNATEQAITWGTQHISPKDSATHQKRTQLGAANREKGDGEGGVVVLLHEKWRHRLSTVKRHSRGR